MLGRGHRYLRQNIIIQTPPEQQFEAGFAFSHDAEQHRRARLRRPGVVVIGEVEVDLD